MVIGSYDAEFEIFDDLLPSARFDVGRCFFRKIIRVSKISMFVNFYLDLYFRGHLLDGQTKCDNFGENLMKTGRMVSEIFNVFFLFSR